MKAECLASSSSGNCFILEFDINGVPTRIMVECGIPIGDIYKKLNDRGIMLSTIQACLITHGHQDHCKSASRLKDLGIPIYASKPTLELCNCEGNELILEKPNRVLNGLFVMPFLVEHDCEGSIGFVIKTKDECVIFVNDHKRWTCDLSNFKPDYVFIECNYYHTVVYAQLNELKKLKEQPNIDEKTLTEINIKIAQHERNIESHCSLRGTIKGLEKLNLSNTKVIFLMHLSDRYANEYVMKNDVQDRFGIRTYVCKKIGGIK